MANQQASAPRCQHCLDEDQISPCLYCGGTGYAQPPSMTAASLRAWRELFGATQEEAAAMLRTPLGTYQGWEQDRHTIPGVVAVACESLGRQAKGNASAGGRDE